MNTPLAKLKRTAILLAGISAASIPTWVHADWSMTGLGNLGGSSSFATGINDSGQVVGYSRTANGDTHAFITGPDGIGMTDLGTLGGSYSEAQGINDSGQVVGNAYLTGDGRAHAFITGPDGVGMTDLGTLGGLVGINDSGQVAGYSKTANDDYYAFITGPDGIGMTDLGTLGGTYVSVSDINDSGQVVGRSWNADDDYHAFITGPDGMGMTDLGTLGGSHSGANGINDLGEVVGEARIAVYDQENHAFLFSHGGITDLSLLDVVVADGWRIYSAADINNNGQIIGTGIDGNGIRNSFLLSYTPDTVFTPQPIFIPSIPEPETYAMLLAGLGLVGFMARRRKKASM